MKLHEWSSKWILLCISLGFWSFSSTSAVAPLAPAPGILKDWVKAKCGPSGVRLWKYQGSLFDPLDGRKVANVEGLELVSLLRRNETRDLAIYSQVLNRPNASWEMAATLWSQNIFCYTLPTDDMKPNQTIKSPSSLLRHIRVRPYSPEKPIPLDQSVGVYERATTFIERPNGDLLVHSEWPHPHQQTRSGFNKTLSLWSDAFSINNNAAEEPKKGFGFSIYAKLRNPKSASYFPDLSPEANQAAANRNSTNLVVSPKRSSWIQFGLSNMESKHKFGARETYSMTLPPSSEERKKRWLRLFGKSNKQGSPLPRMVYSRYGEGPPFYAPGRMCMLELQAEPILDLSQASPVIQSIVANKIEGWNRARFEGLEGCSNALRLGYDETLFGQDPLQRYKAYAVQAWEKAKPITRLVSIFQNEKRFW